MNAARIALPCLLALPLAAAELAPRILGAAPAPVRRGFEAFLKQLP
jgi:hypothetical protein